VPSTSSIAPAGSRRQARFAAGRTILPQDVAEGRWYDVCAGRRRGDDRPGMVMLDLGTRREHVPVACLEFRTVPDRRGLARAVPRRALALAASLVPVVAAAVVLAARGRAG
jgi:hypothetical protein